MRIRHASIFSVYNNMHQMQPPLPQLLREAGELPEEGIFLKIWKQMELPFLGSEIHSSQELKISVQRSRGRAGICGSCRNSAGILGTRKGSRPGCVPMNQACDTGHYIPTDTAKHSALGLICTVSFLAQCGQYLNRKPSILCLNRSTKQSREEGQGGVGEGGRERLEPQRSASLRMKRERVPEYPQAQEKAENPRE